MTGDGGGYYDRFYGPPPPTTGEKILKAAKIVTAVAAPVLTVGAAVTFVPPIHDAAVGIVEGIQDKLGQTKSERAEDWKNEIAKQNATPLAQPTQTVQSQIPLTEFTSTPIPTLTKTVEDTTQYLETYEYGDFTFYLKDGLPGKYKKPNGEEVILTPAEKEKMKAAHNLAIASKEIQIGSMITIEEETKPTVESPDHPVLEELPADVLSDEKLKEKYNITITQEKPTFFIRETALTAGMPLADCANGEFPFEFYVIDEPFLSDALLPRDPNNPDAVDPRYQHAQDALLNKGSMFRKEPTKLNPFFAEQQLKSLHDEIETIRQELTSTTDPGKKDLKERLLFKRKAELAQLDSFTNEQWKSFERSELLKTSPKGELVGGYSTVRDEDDKRIHVILLATGKSQKAPKELAVAFDPSGSMTFTSVQAYDIHSVTPQADQSFPDPAEFKMRTDAKWPEPQVNEELTPGMVTVHELGHYHYLDHKMNTISGNDPKYTNKKTGQQDYDAWWEDVKPNYSEYDPDQYMLDYMLAASKFYKDTGQDTKFGFVFRLTDGRYIVTEKVDKKPKNSTQWLAQNFFPEQRATTHARKTMNPDTVVELVKTPPAPDKIFTVPVNGENREYALKNANYTPLPFDLKSGAVT